MCVREPDDGCGAASSIPICRREPDVTRALFEGKMRRIM